MIVSIITEGLKNTGYGHITRCVSLYQAFEEAGTSPVLFVYGDDASEMFLDGLNYNIINWLKDEDSLLNLISDSDVSVIDSYLANQELYYKISSVSDLSVFIDDNLRIDYPDGIIVNGTISANDFFIEKKNSICLLSSKYIPLRKEFWNISHKKIKDTVDTVLLTLGGQDIRNLTLPLLEYLIENFPGLNKNVVIGQGFNSQKEIKKLLDKKTTLIENANAQKIKQQMLEADFAVTAGGQTLYELASVGLPPITVGVAENQKNNINGWEKAGFIEFIGWWNDPDIFNNLGISIKKIESKLVREEKSRIGKHYVDGQGSRHVAKKVTEEISKKKGFYLKNADLSDAKKIFELSNTLHVRQQSISENKILWEEHIKWFNKKVNDKNYIFFVAYYNEDFISQVRFEINSDEATISISLEEKFRSRGLGSKIIHKACKEVFLKRRGLDKILAYILPDNIASIKSFIKAGFEYSKHDTLNGKIFNLYTLKRKKIISDDRI